MAKERKSAYRAQFDGHRRLAAAVILQAIKDVSSGGPSPQEKETAADFLQGDMWPFSDVLDLPADGAALQVYLKNADLSSLSADPATN